MSIQDVVEDIERNCWRKRYDSDVMETAENLQGLFDNLKDAAEYVASYEEFYSDSDIMDDPEGYAESWYRKFGDVEGIVESLE